MSDRRCAIGLFGRPPLGLPRESFAREVFLHSAQFTRGDCAVAWGLTHTTPIVDHVDALGPELEQFAMDAGAIVAIIDPFYNLTAPPTWTTDAWDAAWIVPSGLFDDLLLSEVRWKLAWIRQAEADAMPSPIREALTRHYRVEQGAHGLLVRWT